MSKIAVGIDLGTTYSCVAVWIDDRVVVVPDTDGNRIIPSYVSFGLTDRSVGTAAKDQALTNMQNTIYDAKRIIGRSYDQIEKFDWPFEIINSGSKPVYRLTYQTDPITISPEEISAAILSKLKSLAESFVGAAIDSAVITVPAYFTDAQRQATSLAAKIAGLDVLRMINEPTAAAMAYGSDKNIDSNICVYDFGGGTLDVSVLNVSDKIFEVKSTSGNNRLGGQDITNCLTLFLVSEFEKKYQVKLPAKSVHKIRLAAEQAKRDLSLGMQTTVSIDSVYDGIDFIFNLTRAKFESVCQDIFKLAMKPVLKAISDSGLEKNQISEIILVGGSTRIPKIRSMLKQYFGIEPNSSVDPDQCVAIGAAIQAAILTNFDHPNLSQIVLLDVSPLSLGIATAGGLMINIIDRNTKIPCKRFKTFTTVSRCQPTVSINIYEGERRLVKHNNFLGSFMLENIQNTQLPQIDVCFELDVNGILNVSAIDMTDKIKKSKKNLTITNHTRFTSDQIEQMISNAKKFEQVDQDATQQIESKIKLQNLVTNVSQSIIGKNLEEISVLCNQITDYLAQPECPSSISEAKYLELLQLCENNGI